ncbi:PRKR-interacting protein 1 isoform X2 [Eubalaena glacialis]|uniref:PRKR-interacting protein 1 isoform X2 n=1 Tax=Eubalaena glacialis TaxID=27606 RepID=UPI002A5A4B47|nr:PRKR-interacting protein 1 isoform X2 [Eubalaena glacialis]
MASSAASSVRPPRPKKEPQALVIPKNAAEEQKLKLERLMKNPVQALGPAAESSMCTGICAGESTSDRTTWMPWLRRGHGFEPWSGGIPHAMEQLGHEPQLLSLRVWSLCSATREAAIVRGPRTAMKSGPCSPQLEKALAQKRRPNTAKNK